jgi:hypothetical protein
MSVPCRQPNSPALCSYKGMVRFVRSKPHWNFARLQSPSSNDCTQNFSCRYAVQGCEKIAQIWNVEFKFAPPRTRMSAVCLLTVRELKSSSWYVEWWVTSCCAIEKEIFTLVKHFMLLSILKTWIPHSSFILQTSISSSCMFSRWTIKHPLLLPTLPRSVGIFSPTSPV